MTEKAELAGNTSWRSFSAQQKSINVCSLKDVTNVYQFTAMYEAQVPFQSDPWLSELV